MAYNEMGDYSAGPVDPYEAERLAAEEEERKRREQEARMAAMANPGAGIEMPAGVQPSGAVTYPVSEGGPVKPPEDTVEQKHEVITYADGSQTRKTTQEVPAKQEAKQEIPYYQQYLNEGAQAYGLKPQFGQQSGPATRTAVNPETGETYQQLVPGSGAISNQDRRANQRQATGDETFDRQIQAESNGNHIDPKTGQITTSPKGALGIAQVMPKSAMQPGFGIKDIFTLANERGVPFTDRSEASAKQLLSNKDLNLEMGKNYRDGMLNYFGGDNEKAVASYNAGAGRVNQAVKQAEAKGGNWKDYLPTETKNYLQKTMGPVQPGREQSAQQVISGPSYGEAGAGRGMAQIPTPDQGDSQDPNPNAVITPGTGTRPVANVDITGGQQPTAQPGPVDPNAYTGQGLRAPGVTPPVPGEAPASTAIDRYQAAQNDPMELLKMRNDDSIPKAFRDRAGNRAADILQQGKTEQQVQNKVKEQLETGDLKSIAKDLGKKPMSQFDLLWQSTMMRLMGANAQADKLYDQAFGTGGKSVVETDDAGNKIQVDYDSQGKVTGGLKADGTSLDATQAIAFASGGTKIAKPDVSMQDVEATIDGKVVKGRVVTTYDRNNKPTTQVESGGKKYEYDGKWKATSIGAAAEKAETASAIKLRYAGPTSYTEAGAKAAGEFNFQNGTNIGYQSQQPGAPLVDLNTGKPVQVGAGGVITTTQSGTPGAAPAQGGTTTTGTGTGGQTPAQITGGAKTEQAVTQAEREQFVNKALPEVNKRGEDGRYIADTRRTQIAMLTGTDSAIMGIYRNSGSEYNKAKTIIADIIGGTYSGKDGEGKFADALMNLRIKDQDLAAIKTFQQMNRDIDSKTLAVNAGEGPKSDADMRMNREANMGNIGDLPAYSALNGLSRSQFAGDINKQKADFAANNRDKFQTETSLNQAWGKEKDKINKQYEGIYKERLNFIESKMVEKFGRDWRKQPGDTTQGFYRDASIHSFAVYATPNYNMQTGSWDYPTQQSKLAAMRAAVR
jgi:YD repeat-containing protein